MKMQQLKLPSFSKKMKLSANQKLIEYYQKIGILQSVVSLLQWDNSVMMPTGGAALRGEQLTLLSQEIYRLSSSTKLGDLIADAEDEALDAWQLANLNLIKKNYLYNQALDETLVKAFTKASLACELNWREARKANNFKLFAKYFAEVLTLTQEKASRLAESFNLSKYDVLLDLYDPGLKSAEVDIIFADLEKFLPEFIGKAQEKQKSIIPFVDNFAVEKQKELGIICMKALGFDLNKGRLDVSTHPFSTGFSPDDVRITTRYNQADFLSGLNGILHETGHALYEQNLPSKHSFQPVAKDCGMTIHESQSLFVERQIGISKEFFAWLNPHVKAIFGNDKSLSPENLYNMVNKVTPSFIRVDADEVTYPAHIIMRYRLEKALLSGDLPIDEVPTAWEEQSLKLLQIKPSNFSEGCLQDIHWSCGALGYFPTYTLGAMLAAQIEHTMNKSLNCKELIAKGEFKPIITWLNEKIHSKGCLFNSSQLIQNATGSKLDSNIFKAYLSGKYLA